MRGGCLAPRWYVFIDDDRSYLASPVMILPGGVERRFWSGRRIHDRLGHDCTYRRVVKAATEAFTLAALVDQGEERPITGLSFLAIHGELA